MKELNKKRKKNSNLQKEESVESEEILLINYNLEQLAKRYDDMTGCSTGQIIDEDEDEYILTSSEEDDDENIFTSSEED